MNLIKVFAVASLSLGVLEASGSETNDLNQNIEVNDTSNTTASTSAAPSRRRVVRRQMATSSNEIIPAPVPTAAEASVTEQVPVATQVATSERKKRARSDEDGNPELKYMKTPVPFRLFSSNRSLYRELLRYFNSEILEHGLEILLTDPEYAETHLSVRLLDITTIVLKSLERDKVFRVDQESGETILNYDAEPARLRLFGYNSALIAHHNIRNGVRLPDAVAAYLRSPERSCLELLKEADRTFYNSLIGLRGADPNRLIEFSFADYEDPCNRANPHPQTPDEIEEFIELVARNSIQPDRLRYIREGFELVMSTEMIAAREMTAADFNIALTDYSDYTSEQLRYSCEIENIEGNKDLVSWFFTAIDQLTPHERRMFFYFFTGLRNIPRHGLGSLDVQPRITVVNDRNRFGYAATTCFNRIMLYQVESFEIMLNKLKSIASAMEL